MFSKTDELMVKVMQKLGLPIEEWKLRRHLTIQRTTNLAETTLTIAGIETDGTPASIFSKVQVSLLEKVGVVRP